MKHIIKVAFAVLILPLMMFAFVEGEVSDQITKALKSGDASAVAKFFDSSVDVTILEDSDTYSKSQAEQVLKSFFDKNKVTDYKVLHEVDSKNGASQSFVGQLTAGGKNFRVYVLLSNSGSSQIIQEISIREK